MGGTERRLVGQHGDYTRSQSSCLRIPAARSGKMRCYCATGSRCRSVLEYFSRGKAVNLDTNIKANTQASVRFPQVYLKAFYHEQNLTKYSKLKSFLYFLHSNCAVRGLFMAWLWVRGWPWYRMQLLVTALTQESSPISRGLACNPTYFSNCHTP